MSAVKKRYAQVGLGARSGMFTRAVTETHAEFCEMVALCDTNQSRMDFCNRRFALEGSPFSTYKADEFDRMVAEAKPDVVIVTSMDSTHADYICRSMDLGCDVISEKPMTIDEASCRRILQTIARTGRQLRVTFNYRYSPPRSQVKELLRDGAIGEVLSVDFSWLLNTRHGADYFRRWHRRRENSGSLLVHKATHHFDLVNWWLGDVAEEVFAHAALRFYVPATASAMGLDDRGERCLTCPAKDRCEFFYDLHANEGLEALYLNAEGEDGYFRDRCVFAEEIDIWDDVSVAVRYAGGALLNYSLTAHSPYEGYRIALNGTRGRLEHQCCEKTYTSGDGTVPGELIPGKTSITLIPAFSQPQAIEPRSGEGGHGGGDPLLLADLFDPNAPADPLARGASHRDGAYSILVGVAAYHSIDSGKPIKITDLLGDAPID